MSPVFSIIIPTYNRASQVVQAIESCLAQDFTSFEVIVVDDGSSDNTVEKLREYFTDPRIKLYEKHNTGASDSRNYGVSLAIGKYICFLDSDDKFTLNKLSVMSLHIAALDAGNILHSKVELFSGAGTRVKPIQGRQGEDIFDYIFLNNGFVPSSSIVLLREIAVKIKWSTAMVYGDDTDYLVRLHLNGYKLKIINDVLVKYFDHADENRLSLDKDYFLLRSWADKYKHQISRESYVAFVISHLSFSGFWVSPLFFLRYFFLSLFIPKISMSFIIKQFVRCVVPVKLYRILLKRR